MCIDLVKISEGHHFAKWAKVRVTKSQVCENAILKVKGPKSQFYES
jgi:hypothetical protein